MTDEKPAEMQLLLDPSQAKPVFSNYTQATYTRDSWILDFLYTQNTQALLVGRMAITPTHLKNLTKLFMDQVKEYESKFGEIKTDL